MARKTMMNTTTNTVQTRCNMFQSIQHDIAHGTTLTMVGRYIALDDLIKFSSGSMMDMALRSMN